MSVERNYLKTPVYRKSPYLHSFFSVDTVKPVWCGNGWDRIVLSVKHDWAYYAYLFSNTIDHIEYFMRYCRIRVAEILKFIILTITTNYDDTRRDPWTEPSSVDSVVDEQISSGAIDFRRFKDFKLEENIIWDNKLRHNSKIIVEIISVFAVTYTL